MQKGFEVSNRKNIFRLIIVALMSPETRQIVIWEFCGIKNDDRASLVTHRQMEGNEVVLN